MTAKKRRKIFAKTFLVSGFSFPVLKQIAKKADAGYSHLLDWCKSREISCIIKEAENSILIECPNGRLRCHVDNEVGMEWYYIPRPPFM